MNRLSIERGWLAAVGAMGGLLLGLMPAEAQVTPAGPPAAAAPAAAGQLEEVIVTATKRSENLQSVPMAVTAISGAAIAAEHAYDIRDLADSQPGVAFTESDPFDQQLAIRGIVTVHLGDPTAEPSVATFVDGVYIGGQGVTLANYYDIDRIEITRGPQGVLYGKNVTGGAVSVVTAKPEFAPSGAVDASYGSFESASISGHWTDAINDVWAYRAAFQFRTSTGYGRALPIDRHMNGYSSEEVRASLLYRPSDAFQGLLSVDFGDQWTPGTQRSATADPFSPPPGTPLLGGVVFGGETYFQQLHGMTTLQSFDMDHDYTQQQSVGATLTLDWNFIPDAKLTSISNARVGMGKQLYQQLQAPSPPLLLTSAVFEDLKPHEYSEDLRITSTEAALPFSYIAGLYWYRNDETADSENFAISPQIVCANFINGGICGHSQYSEDEHTETEAVYGQIGYEIVKGLTLTVGARETSDKKSGTRGAHCYSNEWGFPTCATPLTIAPGQSFLVPFGHTWKAFTPQALLDWQITPTSMAYASFNKGFKGGGWDQFPANATVASIGFNPEYATNYEVGTKNEFFDRRVRLNVSLYYLDYKNLQVQEINDICLCLITNNAGAAISKGIEIETQFVLSEAAKLTLNESYNDAKYVNFIDAGVNESGHQLQLAPANKANIGVSLTPDFGGQVGRAVNFRVEYTLQSKYYLAPAATNYQAGFGLLNAFIAYAPKDAHWSVSAWGRNLTDKLYPLYANAFLGDVQTSWAPPREYGVSAHYDFNGFGRH